MASMKEAGKGAINTVEDLLKPEKDKYNNFAGISLSELEKENKVKYNEENQLTYLDLSDNKIHSLHFLIDNADLFKDLEYLNLSNNLIRNLCWYPNLEKNGEEKSFFTALEKLKALDLSGNDIRRGYDCLNDLKKLETLILTNEKELDLSNKGISDISFIEKIKDWENFNNIKLNDNPYISTDRFSRFAERIKKEEDDNDKNCIKALKYIFSDNSEEIRPQKIMLIGNHAVGKSTFLNKFDNNYTGHSDSTHVLSIHELNNEKIFFDFGGQDYYHGITQMFFNEKSLNLLFWNEEKIIMITEKTAETVKIQLEISQ